jgi:hypothetical protein
MAKNRFEQVDETQADAITLALTKRDGVPYGRVTCPAEVTGGKLKEDVVSDEMGAVDAFRSAIKLANEIKAAVVVVDPDGAWQPEWGVLERADGDA